MLKANILVIVIAVIEWLLVFFYAVEFAFGIELTVSLWSIDESHIDSALLVRALLCSVLVIQLGLTIVFTVGILRRSTHVIIIWLLVYLIFFIMQSVILVLELFYVGVHGFATLNPICLYRLVVILLAKRIRNAIANDTELIGSNAEMQPVAKQEAPP